MSNFSTKTPYISFCSGYEGIGEGLKRCIPNIRTIAYVEREAFAIANLVEKAEKGLIDPAPVFSDVVSFPYDEFRAVMGRGIVSAGFPCQPFSTAGKRQSTADERWLFDILADGFERMRPAVIVCENVDGLLSAKMPDGSLVIAYIHERLEKMGYRVEVGVFSAAEVGAPHQRKRVFILAVRGDISSLGFCGGVDNTSGNGFWPARPGEEQYGWEPPRTTKLGDDKNRRRGEGGDQAGEGQGSRATWSDRCDDERHETEPTLGGNADGSAFGLDFAELSVLDHNELAEIFEWMEKGDNRTDELRLLGNGVVPSTAEKAFRTLWRKLGDT